MDQTPIRIGTRGSKLALYQANFVKDLLSESFSHIRFELVIIATKGDKILDVALSKIGDKGLFTKELERAMFDEEIDMAVHSLKDLPTQFPEGAELGAVLERGEYRDVLVSRNGLKLEELGEGQVVATSSLRRKAQIHRINPKVSVIDIRGNVDTRLQKMHAGYCDAMIMAGAGLIRLGYEKEITQFLEPSYFVSAPGQGAIAIEIREDDSRISDVVQVIHSQDTYLQIIAERSFLNELEGGCQIPIGSHALILGDKMTLTGLIAMPDGTREVRGELSGRASEAEQIGRQLARTLSGQGGDEILKKVRQLNDGV
jgi:hydroxymethylbilane synthase